MLGELGENFRELHYARPLEIRPLLHSEIERGKLRIRVLVNLARAVRNALKRRIVDGDDLPILRPPEVELDFRCPKRDRRAEGGHAVFRCDGGEPAVRAQTLRGGVVEVGDDRAPGGTILPRAAADLNVVGMKPNGITEAHRFEELGLRIELDRERTDAAVEVAEYLATRSDDHRTTADRRIKTHADRGPNEIRARVVGEVPAN